MFCDEIYMGESNIRLSELEDMTVEELREQLAKLDRMFTEKEQGGNGTPTAKEIEEMWGELLSKTKDIYADHISHRVNNVNEKPIIERKKESI